jgi:hypothetical protein
MEFSGAGAPSQPTLSTQFQFLKFNPAGRRLHPPNRTAFIKPFVRKAAPSDINRIFGPFDYLFVSVMQLSKTICIAALIGMVSHGLFAIGGFYFSFKLG